MSLAPTENLPFGHADAQVDEQGKFTLTNVGAMTYRISVQGLTGGSYLVSGKYGTTEALNDLLQNQRCRLAAPIADRLRAR